MKDRASGSRACADRAASAASAARPAAAISVRARHGFLSTPTSKRLMLALALILLPLITVAVDRAYVVYIYSLVMVYVIVTLGLNILTGYTGQISIGHAGFMAISAYASAILTGRFGLPFPVAMILAALLSAVVGLGLGIPALRLRGHYLAICTLGFGVAVSQLSAVWEAFTGGYQGMKVPTASALGFRFDTDLRYYYLALVVTWLLIEAARNMLHTRPGRALMAVRDSEVAAQAMGINLSKYKVAAFAISAFYAGMAGSLYAHLVKYVSPFDFSGAVSMTLLASIVVGGLGSVPGSILGAVFMTLLPHVFSRVKNLPLVLSGISLILVVLFLPYGLVSLPWRIRSLRSGVKRGASHGDA
ncbi:MAG: branched-chain amino acid ABC transporter permease [Clostridia bacterium]|nr:branched-chain amino acid ABC transporter permease [Clostridia bacterium]